MKKTIFIVVMIVLITSLVLTGCQKKTEPVAAAPEADDGRPLRIPGWLWTPLAVSSGCRLRPVSHRLPTCRRGGRSTPEG